MPRDTGLRNFWIAVAAIAVTGGVGLRSWGYPTGGRWLFWGGLLLAAVLAFGVLSEWAAREISPASMWLLRVLRDIAKFTVEAIAWLGALPLAPVIRRVLREQGLAETQTLSWTAERKRGQQGSDFRAVDRKGHRIAAARFIVRPDYPFSQWHAGFRLTQRDDNLEKSDLRATVLVQIRQNGPDTQLFHSCHCEGADWGPWGIPRYNHPKPSYEFDASIYQSAQAGTLNLVYSIDGDVPQRFSFPDKYAEQIAFVAWADGQDFRVNFEQIWLAWTPFDGGRET